MNRGSSTVKSLGLATSSVSRCVSGRVPSAVSSSPATVSEATFRRLVRLLTALRAKFARYLAPDASITWRTVSFATISRAVPRNILPARM